MNSFLETISILTCHKVFGRSALAKIDNAVATLLSVLYDTYTRDNADLNLQRRSIELLVEALAACRPTELDRKIFADLNLKGFVVETGKRVPVIYKTAKEVLKKFGTSEWLNFLCRLC